jgi:CDP-diacylglycerol--serine O-phosphatidyltransferase
MDQPPRRFSMIRDFQLADVFTLLNGFAGTGAVLSFMGFLVTHHSERFWLGVGLLPIALVMDVLDGRIARWRHEVSSLGQEMDS